MTKLAVHDSNGKKVGEVKLSEKVFAAEANSSVLHNTIRAYRASLRSGTASTKTRSEARGGGAKPWRQKGTGRARAGSIRSPLWRGGGTTFGPKPKDHSITVPKKVRRLALKSALSTKLKDSELVIVDKINFKEPKTKQAQKMLEKLKVKKKTTIVLGKNDEIVEKSLRNIPFAQIAYAKDINAYHVLDNDILVMTRDALDYLTEALEK